MFMRVRFKQLGGHIHCRVFTGQTKVHTLAKNGDLVFDEKEWPAVRASLEAIAEVVPESTSEIA